VIKTFFVGTVGIALAGAALTPSEPADAQSKAADNPAQQQPVVQAAEEKLDGTVFHAQVLLDRAGFSPGVIDGLKGTSFEYAVRGFQEARGLQVTGELDNPTRQALLRDKAPSVRRLRIDEAMPRAPSSARSRRNRRTRPRWSGSAIVISSRRSRRNFTPLQQRSSR
jgi:hypothetical protein